MTSLFDAGIASLSRGLLDACRDRGVTLATAESCTGGLISGALTEIPGSSDVFERGFVTYSNEAKIMLLGVPSDLIHRFGAVSEEVARAMAEGALARAPVDLSIAVTGVAGPGGTDAKPEGLVHFATALRGSETLHATESFGAVGRSEVRRRSVARALSLALDLISLSE